MGERFSANHPNFFDGFPLKAMPFTCSSVPQQECIGVQRVGLTRLSNQHVHWSKRVSPVYFSP